MLVTVPFAKVLGCKTESAVIRIQGKIPRKVIVACSGGADSMAVADFLKNNHQVELFYYNHGTEHSDRAEKLVAGWAWRQGMDYQIRGGKSETGVCPKDLSQEEHWRNCRYKWFHSFDLPVITAHHLDDCTETWIWSSLHGEGKVIPYRNRNVIRPFRLVRKRDFELWCDLKDVPYVRDESNSDTSYTRNYIRHKMMPHVQQVNPGIHKVIRKKLLEEQELL